jgi:hypothetical protein
VHPAPLFERHVLQQLRPRQIKPDSVNVHLGYIRSAQHPHRQNRLPPRRRRDERRLAHPPLFRRQPHPGADAARVVLYQLNPTEQPTPTKLIGRNLNGSVVATTPVG